MAQSSLSKLISIVMLSFLLLACASDDKSDPNQTTQIQAKVLNVNVDLEEITLRLKDENSATVVLTRILDDGTETDVNLVISWVDDKLTLTDELDNPIELIYDKDTLLEGSVTSVTFTDPGSELTIEIDIVLIFEPTLSNTSASVEQVTIDLNAADHTEFQITNFYSDNTELVSQYSFFWIQQNNTLLLRDSDQAELEISYDSTSLDLSAIPVTFNDPISNSVINIEVVIISVNETAAPQADIQQYVLSPNNTELQIGDSSQLEISVLLVDETQGVVSNDVKCAVALETTVIEVSADCSVTALQAGQAEVTVISDNGIDDSLVQKATVVVLEPHITKIEIEPASIQLVVGMSSQLAVKISYSDGSVSNVIDGIAECFSASSLVTVSTDCKVEAKAIGNAAIELNLLLDQSNIQLINSEVEVVAATVTRLKLSPTVKNIQPNDVASFKVFADFDNGQVDKDVTSISRCTISETNPNNLLSVNGCDFTAIGPEGSATISAELLNGSVVNDVSTATLNVSQDLVYITEVEFLPHDNQIFIDDLLELSVKLTFSNGSIANNDFDLVKCVSDSPLINITPNCKITANSEGSAEIRIETINFDGPANPVLANTTIDVLTPSITRLWLTPASVSLQKGESTTLTVNADYDNGDSNVDVTALSNCAINTGSELVSQNSCTFTAIDSGISEIIPSLIDGTVIGNISPATIEVLPFVIRVEIVPLSEPFVETQQVPLTVNVIYSDGEAVVENDFNFVSCQSDSSLISVSVDCHITAFSAGNASINLVLATADPSIETSVFNIDVVALEVTQLRINPENTFLQTDDVTTLQVLADYNNGDVGIDITSEARCLLISGAGIVSITENCELTARSNGSAEIGAELRSGTSVNSIVSGQVEVSDVLALNSGEVYSLDAIFFGGAASDNVSCDEDFDLFLDTSCQVYALTPGIYNISAALTNSNGVFLDTVNRQVSVNAIPVGTLSPQTNEFQFTIPTNAYGSAYYELNGIATGEIYKVTMADPLLSVSSPDVKMSVLPNTQTANRCGNTLPFGENRVACGIQATNDTLYILLENFIPNSGLAGKFTIETDADILQYAGPRVSSSLPNPTYLDIYDLAPINVGVPLNNQHVQANLDAPIVSRYFTSLELGMNNAPNSPSQYKVQISFDTGNFDQNSAVVKWFNEGESVIPGGICFPQISLTSMNTLECSVENTHQSHLFVEVHGSGADSGQENTSLSNITAIDGEIGYSILITQP